MNLTDNIVHLRNICLFGRQNPRKMSNKLPQRERTSSSALNEPSFSVESQRYQEMSKNLGLLISLVAEVKQDINMVEKKVDGSITKVNKIEKFMTDASVQSGNYPPTPSSVTVNSNLSPISALTEEGKKQQDGEWIDRELTKKLQNRLLDPLEMETIATAEGAEFLMMIRFV